MFDKKCRRKPGEWSYEVSGRVSGGLSDEELQPRW